ncbi:MAG TPA: hypothetical protein VJY35_04410 [Candidatus Eisenbacteria bacterium]|nr:hypothetical protein [Candidatus Eisenbacteria bacterium]
MTRMRVLAALATIALLGVAGCSNLPTGPRSGVISNGGDPGAQTAGFVPMPEVLPEPEPEPQPGEPVEVSSTRQIHGFAGGTVSAGNFTVVIPPLAVAGNATVKVTQPDASKPYVKLEIFPAAANKFRVPVTLVAHASPMGDVKLQSAYISWFNPATGKWERIASSVSLETHTVTATLKHFSEYAVEVDGKAGW